MESERSELTGTILDTRYRVGSVLGVGGTAVCFEAISLEDGSACVIKTLRPMFVDHPDLVRRLKREGEITRTVPHAGITRFIDEGVLPDGSPYLVIERLYGECLARLLRRVGTLSPDVVGLIATRVAAILQVAHASGYVHRDVKPEHIVFTRDESGSLAVRLLDFGVCAADTAPEGEKQREVGRVFGTPSYVSPEQASGDPHVDGRADVFGLGVVMFEALTGRLPFTAPNVANLLRRIIREDPPRAGLLRMDLDFEWDECVARAMARVPADRFPSMRALARGIAPMVRDRARAERELLALVETRSNEAIESVETRAAAAAA
jgi:eukaryotic-like serine/threonine-protein kinase